MTRLLRQAGEAFSYAQAGEFTEPSPKVMETKGETAVDCGLRWPGPTVMFAR